MPGVHYGLREGDLIAFTAQHRPRGSHGSRMHRGQVSAIHEGGVTLTIDGSQRKIQLAGEHLDSLRLAYAQHVYRQQGATVERSVVLTGGWQTSKETATSRQHAPATAPTGSSPATTSAPKDRAPAHHTPRPTDVQQPRANPIARAPRAARSRMGLGIPNPDRAQPPQSDTGDHPRHQPRRPT